MSFPPPSRRVVTHERLHVFICRHAPRLLRLSQILASDNRALTKIAHSVNNPNAIWQEVVKVVFNE
ncbi:hypothetical protein EWM64_g7605 [Hericium alpestre]|uniref:Uncharacterized protein n=1 Tax=Hericium alpestre TaxID=135208 RepID=A0A4Y9ZQR7_9AGAM|nr:hypothetical protein EWM64_g7605 [Hericium alpestre]